MCGHPTATHSIEFDALLCDSCYRRALIDLQADRERSVTTATRIHFDHIRHARDSGVWLGTD